MRVVSGRARGIKLNTIDSLKTRPTTDRVKEAIFSMIQFDLQDAVVLDAYAGSGALGIEALSRGAAQVDFVDLAKPCIKVIKDNLAKTKLIGGAVFQSALDDFLKSGRAKTYDIVLLDPPYQKKYVEKSINWLIEGDNLSKNAIIVVEHNNSIQLAERYGTLARAKDKRYGAIFITIYRREM
ncbi:MAG: 16S rRNA (guanine(966)-N(2))-methyltransferase RsmD [Clostridiales bacterium]|nr:MAG: 16S rRNA (guanine(966)-N(2))-methyltransferase RsmD [Clostridiales bacterium]